jgi:hypothetical protein
MSTTEITAMIATAEANGMIHDQYSEMAKIHQLAREWKWEEVESALDSLYASLGGENPGTGYDYHKGQHPLQIAIREEEEAA